MNPSIDLVSSVAEYPALFDVVAGEAFFSSLSRREVRLLVGALNFHALMAPGRELEVHAYEGDVELTPRTTDDRTFDGASRVFRRRLATVRIRSRVAPEPRLGSSNDSLLESGSRHVIISRDSVLDMPPRRWVPNDPVRAALRWFRNRHPLTYDQGRDLELLRHRSALTSEVKRWNYEAEFRPGGAHPRDRVIVAPDAPSGAPPAVLIGVHWFELGGAERWAFETVRLVRARGLLPIVVSNVDSHHPFLTRPELDGALVIALSEPTSRSQTPGTEQFLRALLRSFDIRGVVVHHNEWLYHRLAWLRRSRPGLPIVDTTHIIEYRGGGFPAVSARADSAIDVHHVISPTLARWFVDVQGVSPDKIVMAPLAGLTVDVSGASFQPRSQASPFTVSFIGRMSRQKSPEIFVSLAARLRAGGHDVRFIMHGDGELDEWVDAMIEDGALSGVIDRRRSDMSVFETLKETDLLVVTSHNEGLTLTTLEAIAHGVPVISTDVGAQSDLIPRGGLFTRAPHAAVRQSERLIVELMTHEHRRRQLWEAERAREGEFLSMVSASEWFREMISKW